VTHYPIKPRKAAGFFVSRYLGLQLCNIAIMKRFLPQLMLTGLAWGQNFISQGYLRNLESSICMNYCGTYYLEDELGNFINYISNDNDSINFSYFINRFVDIEGDSISCVECVGISVSSIDISYDCQFPVNCFVDPCSTSNCYSHPDAECISNYCGSCWSDYYLDNEFIYCGVPDGCIDLSGINFGLCDMPLGIGWLNNNCEGISGCDWIVDSVDYSDALFISMDDCQQSCLALSNTNSLVLPTSFKLLDNYPNPFNPITTLQYDLPKESLVNITIFDILGNVITELINDKQNAGYKKVEWNATNNQGQPVSAGIYLYSIEAGELRQTKKMVLLK
jgi:hypothetical protein